MAAVSRAPIASPRSMRRLGDGANGAFTQAHGPRSDPVARRPLLVTDDVDLLDDLLRLSAAAHVETEVASSVRAVTARWTHAPIVIVGADTGAELVGGNLPRRGQVLLVGNDKTPADWQLATALGAAQVVDLPSGEVWLAERLADSAAPVTSPAPVVGVVGARGGSGVTSFVAGLTCRARRMGINTCAVDLDPFGAGLDLALGGTVEAGLTWADLGRAQGRVPPDPLLAGLARVNDVPVLTWGSTSQVPPSAGALAAVLDSLRQSTELVLLDLPRSHLDRCLEGISRAEQFLLVVPRDVGSVRAAARMLAMPPLAGASIQLVARGPAPGGMDVAEVGELLALPVAASFPLDRSVPRCSELGLAPVARGRTALGRACGQALQALGLANDPQR